MTPVENDPTLEGLRRLAVYEPDDVRRERLRARCRAAMAHSRDQRGTASAATGGAPSWTYALTVAYAAAVINELWMYLRR